MLNKFLISLLLLVFCSVSWAVTVDLTHATVSVPDQSQSSLNAGMLQGFKQVLVKASGNASVNTLPAIEQAESNIQSYVLSYHFDQKQLTLAFDPKAIKQLLAKNGQSYWGANRPQTLVWLNVPSKSGNQFVSDSTDPMAQYLQKLATQSGVPILLPVMDLRDQSAIGSDPASWFKADALEKASARYQLTSLLVGQVIQRPQGWQGRWLAVVQDEPVQWQTNADTEQEAVAQGMAQLANILASQGAVITNGQQQVTVMVNGLDGLSDYAKVVKYLKGLSVVNQVDLQNMSGDQAILLLGISGSMEQLFTLIKQGQLLQAQGLVACGEQRCQGYQLESIGQKVGKTSNGLITTS